jgi:hypothetical protein
MSESMVTRRWCEITSGRSKTVVDGEVDHSREAKAFTLNLALQMTQFDWLRSDYEACRKASASKGV